VLFTHRHNVFTFQIGGADLIPEPERVGIRTQPLTSRDENTYESFEGDSWLAKVAATHEVGTLLVYSHPDIVALAEWIDRYGLDARADGKPP
jgi:hypothetical protein